MLNRSHFCRVVAFRLAAALIGAWLGTGFWSGFCRVIVGPVILAAAAFAGPIVATEIFPALRHETVALKMIFLALFLPAVFAYLIFSSRWQNRRRRAAVGKKRGK